MKLLKIAIITACFFLSIVTFANENKIKEQPAKPQLPYPAILKGSLVTGMYSYLDFDFNSTKATNFNRFAGHANNYAVGDDAILLKPGLIAGLFFLGGNTSFNASMLLNPGSLVSNKQSINSTSIFAHMTKQLNQYFYADLSAMYGYSKYRTESTIAPNTFLEQKALTHYSGNNYFVGLLGQYSRPWNNWLFQAAASINFSQVQQKGYILNYAPDLGQIVVQGLRNDNLYSKEAVELGYNFPKGVRPFVGAGLIQILNFSYNRPILFSTVIGPLPQLSLDENGYNLSAGISFLNGGLRLEYKYTRRTHVYHSNQTLLTLRVPIQ